MPALRMVGLRLLSLLAAWCVGLVRFPCLGLESCWSCYLPLETANTQCGKSVTMRLAVGVAALACQATWDPTRDSNDDFFDFAQYIYDDLFREHLGGKSHPQRSCIPRPRGVRTPMLTHSSCTTSLHTSKETCRARIHDAS